MAGGGSPRWPHRRFCIGMLGLFLHGHGPPRRVQEASLMMNPRAIPEVSRAVRRDGGRGGGGGTIRVRGYYTTGERCWKQADPAFRQRRPNRRHAEPCIEAAKAGRTFSAKKPLPAAPGSTRTHAGRAVKAGVKHQTAIQTTASSCGGPGPTSGAEREAGQAVPFPRLLPPGNGANAALTTHP